MLSTDPQGGACKPLHIAYSVWVMGLIGQSDAGLSMQVTAVGSLDGLGDKPRAPSLVASLLPKIPSASF